jgi:hypothetical protein
MYPFVVCMQEDTLDCVFDLAFRKFKPEDSAFHLDLLELFPTACANVLGEPSVDRYPAQKRAAIAMSEIVTCHGIWLFTRAGTGRRDERAARVRHVPFIFVHCKRANLLVS